MNVTEGALYHYIRNKQEILFRCHKMSLDIGEDALTRAHAEGDNGAEKVSILIRHLVVCLTSAPMEQISRIS